MGNIQQKFSGDITELERALERARQMHIRLEEQIAKMAKTSKESAKETVSSIDRAASGVASAVTGAVTSFLTINTAISAVSRQIDEIIQKAERAKLANLSVADAQAAVIKNIGQVDAANARQFLGAVSGIAQRTNFGQQAPLLTAASSILSATGGNQQRTLGILETAAPFFRDTPGELATFGGTLGDLMKSSGMQDPNQAMAFALSVQGQSRFEQLGGFKNVSPVLAGAAIGAPRADRGVVAKQAAALFAAVGSELGDPEGGASKTAVLKLIENLSTVTGGQGDLFQQLAAVQADPSLMTKGKNGKVWKEFEGQAKLLMEELASNPNSQVMQSVMSAYGQISSNPADVQTKLDQLNNLTPELRTRGREAATAGALERAQLVESQAMQAQAYDIFRKSTQEFSPNSMFGADMPMVGRFSTFNRIAGNYGTERAIEYAIGQLERSQATAINETAWGKDRSRDVEGLGEQIGVLKQMLAELQEIKGATTQTAKKPAGQPGGNEPD